jgi:hypothetical protein
MAHCPPERLQDLADVLDEVRRWPGVSEPKPRIFYLRRDAFLHFHLTDEKRWADARCGADWGPSIDAPIGASDAVKKGLLRKFRRCYDKTLAAQKRK